MHPLSLRLLRFFNPAEERLSASERSLRALRLVSALCCGMMLPFGALYNAAGAWDPVEMRVVWTAVCAGIVAGSVRHRFVRQHAGALHEAVMYAMTAYFLWLGYVNDLGADNAVGLLFVFMAQAIGFSLALPPTRTILTYLGASVAGSVAVALAVPSPGVAVPIFLLSIVSTAILLFLGLGLNAALKRTLARSEMQLAEAERLARVGSWEVDARTGARYWSEGAYRLIGLKPRLGPPPSLAGYLHPDEAARLASPGPGLLPTFGECGDYRVVTAQGAERVLRMNVRVERDRSGQPVRLYGACVDVTDHAEREAALREAHRQAEAARAEAEELARLKSAFLANMSHEIRTPLTSIIGFAGILADEVPAAHRDLVEPIESGGRRLLETLNSVLDLARLEAGNVEIACAPLDVAEEARSLVRMMQPQAHARGIAVEADTPPVPALALADRAALGRILTNLLTNAVKFTDAGRVTLRVRQVPDAVVVEVSDTGKGIPEALLPLIFEPFRQASTGWARTHEGAGLGLAITHHLAEGMGATIHAASTPGEGSTFTLTLRALPAEASAPYGGDGMPRFESLGAPPALAVG